MHNCFGISSISLANGKTSDISPILSGMNDVMNVSSGFYEYSRVGLMFSSVGTGSSQIKLLSRN